jgi:predicted O-methyltransferase YrrM
MSYQLPVVDDTLVWDAWLPMYNVPALSVALELDIFESLDAQPDTPEGLALRRDFNVRGLRALLPMLMQLGFLAQHEGRYQLTEAGKQYMLKGSPFCWGALFKRVGPTMMSHKLLLETINNERARGAKNRAADGWESGHVDMAMAREVTAFMHSHSMAPAYGMIRTCDFDDIRKVLDIGGGSGCFSIALASLRPDIYCTIMELPTICELAQQYIDEAGATAQVDTIVVDMFRQAWPQGFDAHFFSNVFHDWSVETCIDLARKSFTALAPGGCILLHEVLLDDSGTAPAPAVAFSLLMAMGTMGQQFTLAQLREILEAVGFSEVSCQHSYGYYSVVRAYKR